MAATDAMKTPDDRLRRHDRLTADALRRPGTVFLHFDVGTNRDVRRTLYEKLVRFGAMPEESAAGVSVPVGIKHEVATFGLLGLRLLDDLDVEPCAAQLRRVVARVLPGAPPEIAADDDTSAWADVTGGYIATYPSSLELHHITPTSRTTKTIKNLNGLAKLKPAADTVITVELVIAAWEYPLRPSDENRKRVSLKQMMRAGEWRRLNWSHIMRECEAATPAEKLLARDEPRRSRIAANLEPFRRTALMLDFDPLVIGIAFVPVEILQGGMTRFRRLRSFRRIQEEQ